MKLDQIMNRKTKKKDLGLLSDKELLQRFYGDDGKLN